MPALSVRSDAPKRACTQSCSTRRETRNARVAPIDEAKDTSTVPQSRPKMAPATSVISAAPGSDRPVTAT